MNATRNPLKVRLVIEIEVDRDAYDAEYADDATAADVREYVKAAAVSAVDSELSRTGRIYGPDNTYIDRPIYTITGWK